MVTDVIIIGGGAAGLCAAVYIKQNAPQLSVRIMEACPRVAKKLALTGNGRCNITNKNINLSRYHGENVSFCEYALQKYAYQKTSEFFDIYFSYFHISISFRLSEYIIISSPRLPFVVL